MKKIFNYLLAIALVAFQFLPVVNAASITIKNSVVGQEYNAYKIFDVTKSGESNYAYSIESSSEWFNDVKKYADDNKTIKLQRVGETTKYVVTEVNESLDEEHFAAYLNGKKAGKTVTGTATAKGGQETIISGLAAGYYFVDSSLGALCILNTSTDTLDVFEKNSEPTIEKTVPQKSASVGDELTFTITITAGGKADTSYILHDKMTAGLTLNANSFTVKVGNADVADTNYTIKTTGLSDDCTFEILFNENYTASLNNGTVITVTYKATVNENAIINSEVENEAKIQYGNTTSTSSTTTVKNYAFDLVKTDGTTELTGAKFKLYDAKTGGTEIELIKDRDENGEFYRPTVEGETAVEYIEAGSVTIKGLATGTYYLEETEAPVGYNQLTERVAVELNGNLINDNAIEVVNTAGSVLPSTGGMGTTLFIAIGSMMVLGFGVLLVTKLRLSKMSI